MVYSTNVFVYHRIINPGLDMEVYDNDDDILNKHSQIEFWSRDATPGTRRI